MRLPNGGIDIFYIDESGDRDIFTMSAISVPFMRNVEGTWMVVWEDHLRNALEWRRDISTYYQLPMKKELKGHKIASGRGRLKRGNNQLTRTEGAQVYSGMLGSLDFLPDSSIISAMGTRSSNLYGHGRLEAILYAILQRMRTACSKADRLGLVFFDEGHAEYRKLFRKAQVYLPTGSAYGGWEGGAFSKNLPLDNFTKDGNIKESHHSLYIQIADLASYAVFLLGRSEQQALTPWQDRLQLDNLYDSIPQRTLNLKANRRDPQRGIVRV